MAGWQTLAAYLVHEAIEGLLRISATANTILLSPQHETAARCYLLSLASPGLHICRLINWLARDSRAMMLHAVSATEAC